MSSGWLHQKERSYAWAMKLILWLAVNLGRRRSRLLLYPITLYYLFFSKRARDASIQFLERVLSKKIEFFDIFRHYHFFASVFLDRVFILEDGGKDLEVNVHGKSVISELEETGGLLFGSHLGSFEIVRALARILHEKEVANPFQAYRIRLSNHSKKGIRRDRLYTHPTKFPRF